MIRALLLAFAAAATLACAPRGPAPGGGSAVSGDTLRGTVQVAGSEPMTSVVLQGAGGAPVVLEGARPVLLRLQGIEVAVAGERLAPDRFRVDGVRVRAANGVGAVDGVLAVEDGRDVLVLADGTRRAIRRLPEPLRGRTGARIWLAGPLDGDIDSFGVIADAP